VSRKPSIAASMMSERRCAMAQSNKFLGPSAIGCRAPLLSAAVADAPARTGLEPKLKASTGVTDSQNATAFLIRMHDANINTVFRGTHLGCASQRADFEPGDKPALEITVASSPVLRLGVMVPHLQAACGVHRRGEYSRSQARHSVNDDTDRDEKCDYRNRERGIVNVKDWHRRRVLNLVQH
jgi:hypothetical protein